MKKLTTGLAVLVGTATAALSLSSISALRHEEAPEIPFDYDVDVQGGEVHISWGPNPRGSYHAYCAGRLVAEDFMGDVPGSAGDDYTFRFLPDDVCLDGRIARDEVPIEEPPAPEPPERTIS